MQLRLPATSIVALGLVGAASAANLRNRNTNRKLTKSSECIVEVAELLEIEPGTIDATVFECAMDTTDMNGYSGLHRVIKGNNSQMAALKTMHENGQIVPGETVLSMGAGTPFDDEDLFLPPGLNMASNVRRDSSRRRLAVVKGDKPMLAVRVIDSNGLVHPRSAAEMGDDIFGTNGDPVNLKSQMSACSMGQLNIQAGVGNTAKELAPGMIEVTITVPLEGNNRGTIRDAVTTAVQNHLGHSLPGPYQQVMYNLQGCYVDCGWAAYAYINSWNSVYQGNYYYQVGVQMHELGHNFNLAHSGGLNGATYTDHTGLMGNPLYSDDVGKMCFNAAKNYQIGWYTNSEDRIDMSTSLTTFASEEIQMVGVADYLNVGRNGLRVVTKLETGTTTDYFIAFNRAIGVNSQNDEADNEVTIVQAGRDGLGYSQSFLKATLVKGESYTFLADTEFGKEVTVTATEIDLNSDPAVATVCVSTLQGGTCGTSPPVTSPPTKMPVTSPPTKSPTLPPTKMPVPPTLEPTKAPSKQPTPSPTKMPVPPTSPPTNNPTLSPTTGKPTASPTRNPTNPPVAFNCGTIGQGGACKDRAECYWDKGICVAN